MASLRIRGLLGLVAVGALIGCASGRAAAQARPDPNRPTGGGIRLSREFPPGTMGIPQPEPRVTLKIEKKSLGRVLFELFKQAPGMDYQLATTVGAAVFSVDYTDVPLSEAVNKLLMQDKDQAPLVFGFQKSNVGAGGTYLIHREYMEIGLIDGDRRVSLGNARLTQALPLLFQQMRVPFRIEPDVPPILLSIQLRPQNWEQALPQVLLEAYKQEPALSYSRDGETYVVHLLKSPTGLGLGSAHQAVRRVNLSLTNRPLKDALENLFSGSQWKFQISDRIKGDYSVTYNVTSYPEIAALQGILKQASTNRDPITYREGKGVLYIEMGPLPGQSVIISTRSISTNLKTTSLNFTNQRMREVAKLIGEGTGTSIRIAPNVPDIPLTFKIQGATAEQALQQLLNTGRNTLPNLSYRSLDTGSYVVELGGLN